MGTTSTATGRAAAERTTSAATGTAAAARMTSAAGGTAAAARTTSAATGTRATSTDVRWLTDEEQRHWRAFRDGTVLLLDALGRELEDGSGLSLHEYEVMVRLSEAEGRTLRMSQLAADVAHSRSRLTHTIARMENAGLVRRFACSSDARGVNCTLTEAGWAALVAAAPGHVASVREHLVDVLSASELAALGTAMEAVRAHLRGDDEAAD